jgi:peptidyl-tRNA hydrolase, PTH1 family
VLAVVGLGNPGAAYRNTRHNAGFMVLDGMAEGRYGEGISIRQSGMDAIRTAFGIGDRFRKATGLLVKLEAEHAGKSFLLVKPATFMNESGKAVTSLKTRGLIKDLSELLVVVDDVDLELGKVRFREKGSAGGHNGMKSIIGALGSQEFARLRIGVGPRPSGADMVDYVLGTFRPEERAALEPALELAARVVLAWVNGGAGEALGTLERNQLRKDEPSGK